MKLGEALLEVKQIEAELDALEKFLVAGPQKLMSSTLDFCSDFLDKKNELEKKIAETSENILVDGSNTVTDVERISRSFDRKVRLLEVLVDNEELKETEKINVIKKLMEYRTTQRTLESTLEKCYWDNDLLE